MPRVEDDCRDARYLKKPAYFLPSELGPVELDLIKAKEPNFTSIGFT
jgi:hypothetical protein